MLRGGRVGGHGRGLRLLKDGAGAVEHHRLDVVGGGLFDLHGLWVGGHAGPAGASAAPSGRRPYGWPHPGGAGRLWIRTPATPISPPGALGHDFPLSRTTQEIRRGRRQ